ncbi:response regulator [Gymnodinialimonas hymeniacidonis]|uniref:response regulator n=1 Tax=Gymnodinialimonas hymeniacidonis TaxID=3126508 RepID=UPI0034C6C98E
MKPPLNDPDAGADGGETAGDAALPRTIRHLSHDIRAAMSDVIGGLRLVDLRRLDPQTQTQLQRVRAAADILASLVDDALFAASGESPMTRDAGPVELEPWLASLLHRWQGQAAEQGRALHLVRHGELPDWLDVQPVALTRVVGNLVSNALRHVSDGGVSVHVRAEEDGGVSISVRDEGPGLPDVVLDCGVVQGASEGSGLGLKIARELSSSIGGVVRLENMDIGACATLVLGPELVLGPGAAGHDRLMPDLSALDILVAEDNQTNQAILRHMLDRMGARTRFVGDGRAALTALQQTVYDIALLDIEMPELSGLEVMEAVRAMDGPVAAMPLVAITAYVLRDNREAIYAAGADGIIGKPVASAEDLGHAILRHVGNAAQDILESAPGLTGSALLDNDRMDRLLKAAGPDESAELLARLEEDLGVTLATMTEAFAAQDANELRAQTHILIAISGAVGADRLCHNAEALNIAAKRKSFDRFEALFHPIKADLNALIAEVVRLRTEHPAQA